MIDFKKSAQAAAEQEFPALLSSLRLPEVLRHRRTFVRGARWHRKQEPSVEKIAEVLYPYFGQKMDFHDPRHAAEHKEHEREARHRATEIQKLYRGDQ